MRLYVASKFANQAEVKSVMGALQSAGHIISHDWTNKFLDVTASPADQDAYLQGCGADDFRGVRFADALVLINTADLRDSMTEFGIALGRGTPTYVLYPERRTSVFFHRATLCWGVGELIQKLRAQTHRMESTWRFDIAWVTPEAK